MRGLRSGGGGVGSERVKEWERRGGECGEEGRGGDDATNVVETHC